MHITVPLVTGSTPPAIQGMMHRADRCRPPLHRHRHPPIHYAHALRTTVGAPLTGWSCGAWRGQGQHRCVRRLGCWEAYSAANPGSAARQGVHAAVQCSAGVVGGSAMTSCTMQPSLTKQARQAVVRPEHHTTCALGSPAPHQPVGLQHVIWVNQSRFLQATFCFGVVSSGCRRPCCQPLAHKLSVIALELGG